MVGTVTMRIGTVYLIAFCVMLPSVPERLHRIVQTPISIALLAPQEVGESFVNQVCAETDAIWGAAGIVFDCHRVASNEGRTGQLEVTIDDRWSTRTLAESKTTLGWITFTDAGPEPIIHLSRASIEDLLFHTARFTGITRFTRETMVGRALGRALSHELGHYLLRTKAHTSRGLMRATWSAEDFFAMPRDRFELSVEQQRTAAERAEHERLIQENH